MRCCETVHFNHSIINLDSWAAIDHNSPGSYARVSWRHCSQIAIMSILWKEIVSIEVPVTGFLTEVFITCLVTGQILFVDQSSFLNLLSLPDDRRKVTRFIFLVRLTTAVTSV
jgi:hypothetical protein